MRTSRWMVLALVALFALSLAAPRAQQTASAAAPPAPKPGLAPERFEGVFADSAGAIPRFQAAFFILKINEWSSDEEIKTLAATLKSDGQRALLDAFTKMKPKATMTVRNSMGADMIVCRSYALPSGERIVRLVTNRRMAFAEMKYSARSSGYPFSVIEIRFDAQGKGKGILIASAQLSFGPEGRLDVKAFGAQPFQLMDVTFKPMK
jgi:hypothetical protein